MTRNYHTIVAITIIALTACSAGGPNMTTTGGARCTPGEQMACPCIDGSEGFQTCASDGSSFGACMCAGTDGGHACQPGQKACGGSCVSLDSPSTGCAQESCSPCSFPNATAVCAGGGCAIGGCVQGFADCDGDASNGCEINTTTNPNHCGTCSMACKIKNATAACVSGQCAVGSCDAGFEDCDGVVGNGCEVFGMCSSSTSTSSTSTGGNMCTPPTCTSSAQCNSWGYSMGCCPTNYAGVCENGTCACTGPLGMELPCPKDMADECLSVPGKTIAICGPFNFPNSSCQTAFSGDALNLYCCGHY